jgi:pimeloyl-ACP methyl ester carboxylesterase
MTADEPFAAPRVRAPRLRVVKRLMIALVLLIIVALLALTGVLLAWSPGRPAPLVDDIGRPINGSLSERVFVEINGVRQGMIVQSANPSNPLLLFLHGGPGMPTFFLNTTHPTGLEQDFTVVWWEQRGAGMSFDPDIAPESMTVDQLIADTIAVTNYLRNRFRQEKIYLLGHSWGSFLGIQVAAAAPELFHAYVGMGQLAYQLRSEVAAHAYLLGAYQALGDTAMVRKLEAAPVSLTAGTSDAWMRLRDIAMHQVGVGTTRDMKSVITGMFLPSWREGAYTLPEKIAIWRGKVWSRSLLWDKVLRTDLTAVIKRLEIPVYLFVGRHDYTTNYGLARDYFSRLDAPVKGFYTFNDSAHSPLFEEPQRAREILRKDVLLQHVGLADASP